MQNYNGLLGLELGPRMTCLGQKSIMHIILIYELIAKVPEIKVDEVVQNSPKSKKKKKLYKKEKN